MIRISTVIKRLKKEFPEISGIMDAKNWDSSYNDVIHLGDVAEGGTIDGLPACDYYSLDIDPEEKIYEMGVHKKLIEFLDKLVFYIEPYDPGTWIAYRK